MNIEERFQLALEHYQAGNLEQAEYIYKEILKIQPNNDDVYHNLGDIYQDKGQIDKAVTCYQKALQLNPNRATTYNNLGIIFQDKGQIDKAVTCYQKALQLNPDYDDAYYNLGNALKDKGQVDQAIICYQKALILNPNLDDAYNNLGNIYQHKRQIDEAVTCYQKALQLNPSLVYAHYNLGTLFMEEGKLGEAIRSYNLALTIKPDFVEAYTNLGKALTDCGRLNEAEACFKRSLDVQPKFSMPYSNLLFLMNYNSRYDAKIIFFEHLKFAKKYAEPLSFNITLFTNDCVFTRRLKIGYVSPDFRRHSVAYFIEPVLMKHNREDFELFCYSDVVIHDDVTRRICEYPDHWQSIIGKSDEKVAELIRKDGIDILIDLTGHTANNRILLFARKPAPVQVTWIGYPATTGLSTIDYKIVDRYTDPPGMTEQFHTEKLIRLPESFLCYLPETDCPEVGELPALTTGYVTFGSFNAFAKLSPEVLKSWINILKAVPNAHLLIKSKSLSDRMVRDYVIDIFNKEGIDRKRIEVLSWVSTSIEHLKTYNKIDIGLDTFPYNGTTTTCEAMWMGLPVITLAGNTHASRVGVSLLSNVGLIELIAKTNEEYVEIAVNLARDTMRLQLLRERLRDMMINSPLTDAKRFTINLEKCYREIWETWCKSV